jgi:hypothetical protein
MRLSSVVPRSRMKPLTTPVKSMKPMRRG